MITLLFGPEDAVRCRFARSPLWETVAAVRMFVEPASRGQQARWPGWRGVDPAALGIGLLLALHPRRGYVPDFLTPPPERALATFEEELGRVRRTPLERVREELARSLADRSPADPPADGEALLADPAATLGRIVEALERAWAALVRPHWPAVRDVLADDVRFHAQLLADGGLERLFGELDPRVRWRDGRVQVRGPTNDSRHLGGAGLVLMPSVFTWPQVVVILDEPWQPTLVYPARGVERLWQEMAPRAPDALARLLGRTRAALLADLAAEATTTALAHRHGLAPSTVSEHLGALRDAGLAACDRRRREVVYRRTALGDALCRGAGG
jgi:DNA-binding transcriptional ArsR family regulator